MPAQKRSAETVVAANTVEDDDPLLLHLGNNHEEQRRGKTEDDADADDDDESDRSPSPCNEQKQEYILVKLSEIRKEVQCPICLGIIRKTRTVMECLHRFCRECIDKAMRMGNNECPACRTHCASRRSLRDDPNYDALISALYPDIDKYEEEELAFNEDEKTQNKQIQASIALTMRRQSDALGKKRMAKAAANTIISGSQSRCRGKRKYRASEPQESDNNEDANRDGSRDSSSADEHHTEVKPKRSKRWGRFSSHPTSAASADGDGDENDEINRESLGVSAALIWPSDRLHWGAGGIRSNTRHGNGGNGKNSRNGRLSKLVNCLRNLEEKDNELDIHLMLVSVDEQRAPSLQRPYLCCSPTLLVRHLCQYVALQTALQASEIEIYQVKELYSMVNMSTSTITKPGFFVDSVGIRDNLQVLKDEETLAGLGMQNSSSHGHLLLAYQKK